MSSPPPAVAEQVGTRLLSLLEREKIADLRRAGLSLRAIGRELGRPASTVMRELAAHARADGLYLPLGCDTSRRQSLSGRVDGSRCLRIAG
ncbi:helix-turn-helix domain-containing protein, partial [Microbacterium aurantiacum]